LPLPLTPKPPPPFLLPLSFIYDVLDYFIEIRIKKMQLQRKELREEIQTKMNRQMTR
jgi:hypothetical protein